MPSLSFEKATGISTKLDTKLERIKRAFDLFDTDGNGSLSNEELRAVLTRPGGRQPVD
jgi:Ca2+-binding EF-hand superfamily protein